MIDIDEEKETLQDSIERLRAFIDAVLWHEQELLEQWKKEDFDTDAKVSIHKQVFNLLDENIKQAFIQLDILNSPTSTNRQVQRAIQATETIEDILKGCAMCPSLQNE